MPTLRRIGYAAGAIVVAGLAGLHLLGQADASGVTKVSLKTSVAPVEREHMLMQYCTACHNDKLKTAGMSVVPLDANNLQANQATWEKILRRLSLGEMPPKGMPRPPKEQIAAFHLLAGQVAGRRGGRASRSRPCHRCGA